MSEGVPNGISRRDYFAGLVLAPLANSVISTRLLEPEYVTEIVAATVVTAITFADALIAELDNPKEPKNYDVPMP